jgi:pyridoxamine 5'-phosphate oxidase
MIEPGDDGLTERLRDLRVFEGDLPTFDVENCPEHPAELFLDWLTNAIDAGVRDPHAMTLCTVDADGRPNSRVLILKGLEDGRWQFSTSRTSRKGQELANASWVAANFYWPELGRQVRLRGRALDGGAEDATRDFLARPIGSRAESLTGNQSQPLHRPDDLDLALRDARLRIEAEPGLVPEHWALFHLIPDEVEFWQADPERRHVRLRYELIDQRWSHQRLWP